MRLLYLIDSLTRGGSERSLAALAPGYVARGIELDVAYLHERPGVHEELRRAGARLFCLEGRGGRLGWIRRAERLIRERRPELIHTTLFEADVAGRVAAHLTGVPSVSSLVSLLYGPDHRGRPDIRSWKVRGARAVDKTTARLAVRFHAVSPQVADIMSGRLGIPRERIDVVPRGLDPAELGAPTEERRVRTRRGLKVGWDQTLVVVAARQEYVKGLDVLVRAFAEVRRRLPKARLVVAGRPGGLTDTLDGLVSRHDLRDVVRFLGARDDVPDLLCAADLCVIPSRSEGFPVTLIEAMAMGTRIVATDIPVIRDVTLEGRFATLVRPNEPVDLAAAIFDALCEGPSAERAHAARSRFLKHHTIDRAEDGMLAFYERSLGSSPATLRLAAPTWRVVDAGSEQEEATGAPRQAPTSPRT